MASEILAVPEQYLAEFIAVIRCGLRGEEVSTQTRDQLTRWCDEEEEYLKRLNGDDE